jgi:hypothetical protein
MQEVKIKEESDKQIDNSSIDGLHFNGTSSILLKDEVEVIEPKTSVLSPEQHVSKLELSFKHDESEELIQNVVIDTVFQAAKGKAKLSSLVQKDLGKTCLIRQYLDGRTSLNTREDIEQHEKVELKMDQMFENKDHSIESSGLHNS